ncbi:right-handed parallel beta-helix repeat-containing protein [Pontibacter sp. KCTC 32443]|uniref:right-handed parallel beta-helix repeat-containing protein n=1 Tax=Pontibacter TaxID=323449 RepID=UPI00164D1B54|nr:MULTISPECIES: right-handed parallel beta-helix repeat-containing protein [Pontibacter]MBC5775690.1 right-handed parallel beta-helix repeat-containing protein [Pontibacter sp. KCTC 32443]
MRYLLAILPLLCLLSLLSCEPKDEIVTTDRGAILSFSQDTVLFDTVFVTQGSVTKRLKVYNPNKKAVRISNITLAGAEASPYNLIINGQESIVRNNLELRGKDSLYILVKVNINPNDASLPFLVADSILFDTNGQRQSVKLVAYGQNAVFHRKETIGTTTWTNDLPHVLMDTILVQEGATLTIEKGARIVAGSKGVLLVNGSLQVNGTPEERVVFSGYRREPEYVRAPGQWEGIRILTKSSNNSIKYADVFNTTYGLRIGNPGKAGTLVEGCVIAHAFLDGIIAFTSDVQVVNSLIYNCGQFGFGGLGGGNYEVLYSTIVNYNSTLSRETPAFVVTDYIPDTEIKDKPTSLLLINSIVYSDDFSAEDELLLDVKDGARIEVANNLLRTAKYKDQLGGNGNIFNLEPKFKEAAKYNFRLDTLSPASNAAKVLQTITKDLTGTNRHSTTPDIGAYERVID